jgi:signal transduction histidine kinase
MFLAEGVFFFTLVFSGIVLLYRAMLRETAAVEREKRFLALVTHELKTPLASIQLGIDAISKTKNLQALGLVQKEAKKLQEILEQTLAMSVDPKNSEHHVSHQLLARWANQGRNAGIPIEIDSQNSSPHLAPVSVLNLVLNSLVENSRKHAGTELRIRVGSLGSVIWFEDNGPGITQDDIQRRSYGRGVGLFLAQQLVQSIGGSLRVERAQHLGGARIEVHLR